MDSVHETHERVVVTKNGEPSVVVVAIEDLDSLEETSSIPARRNLAERLPYR